MYRISTLKIMSSACERARWEDCPSWSAWVVVMCREKKGSYTSIGMPACWLPWNRPQRRISNGYKTKSVLY